MRASFALSLLTTGLVLPAGDSEPSVESRTVNIKDVAKEGSTLELTVPIEGHVVGFDWAGIQPADLEVAVKKNGKWLAPVHVTGNPDEGPDFQSEESSARTPTAPVWIGNGVDRVRVHFERGTVRDLRMHSVRSEANKSGVGPNRASASAPQPFIIARAGWGADEGLKRCEIEYASSVRNAFVHHTATASDYTDAEAYQFVRSIYHYHTQSNGWCDIGYNFLIDRFGRVFEGRSGGIDRAVIGAHAGGFNTASTGVSMLGTHTSTPMTGPARYALRSFLGWKLDLHDVHPNMQIQVTSNGSTRYPEGQVVNLWTISGHRDVSTTACPGDMTYADLPSLRAEVLRDIEESRWEWLGGSLSSSPDAASFAQGRLNIFVRGGDGALWQKRWDANGWSGWDSLGGFITADPAAVSWTEGASQAVDLVPRIDVFVRGGDGALWHRSLDTVGWSPWTSLGGFITSGPDVASSGQGSLEVFAVGGDGAIWVRRLSGTTWAEWQSLGGSLTSDPGVVSASPSNLSLFARGGDGGLWTRSWNGVIWSDWNSLGGQVVGGPDAASWAPGRTDVFVRGADGFVWSRSLNQSSWSGWARLDGTVTSDPTAVSWGNGRVDLFARRPDSSLGHRWFEGGNWNQ
jgi:hypothetical protein